MPDWLTRLQGDIARLWTQLSSSQKWMVGGFSGVLIALLLAVSVVVYFLPSGELLYGGLNDSSLGEVTRFLDQKGERYTVRDGGVYVSGDQYKLRQEFSVANRQKTLGGFNVLKEYSWSRTGAEFKELRLRALEEELATTIEKGSDVIDWARVQLTERDTRLFPSDETKPTAAVKVNTRGGSLSTESVQGIQWTVAHALPGLKPADVVVTDENSRVLPGFVEKSESELITSEQRNAEKILRDRRIAACAAILDPIVGGGANYTIAAEVKVNYDKKAIKEKFIDAENPFERRRKTEEISDKDTQTGGIPGTPSNNPDDRMAQGRSSSNGNNSEMTQETSEIDNEPRITRETSTQVAPGEIERQWVSIAVNYIPKIENGERTYVPRTPEQMAELEKSLKVAAAHIDSNTKYTFILTQAPFDRSAVELAESEAQWSTIRENVESAAFLFAAIFSIILFFIFLRKIFTVTAAEEEAAMAEEAVTIGPRAPDMGLRDFGLRAIGEVESLPPEEQKSRMIREEIETYAKGNPEEFVGILRNWLAE